MERQGSDDVQLEFSPAFSLRTQITGALVNGKRTSLRPNAANEEDQHPTVSLPIVDGTTTITLHYRNDFGIDYPYAAPAMGAPSRNLKFVSESWNAAHDRLELQVAGAGGASYDVPLYGDLDGVAVNGGTLEHRGNQVVLRLSFPPGPSDGFTTQNVTLQFPRR